ncbi:MAG: CHAT domain-containing tetratricopeptide repeat protein [Acidobacteriota bacterium]
MATSRTPRIEQPEWAALAAGNSHPWGFSLDEGQVATVRVEQQGIDIVLRLFSPGGERLMLMDSPIGSWGHETITWIAEENGIYRVEVASENPDAGSGHYVFWLEPPRHSNAEDQRHSAAQQRLCRADELRRAGDPAALPGVIDQYRKALAAWRELDDPDWQLQALQRIGHASTLSGQSEEVVEAYRSASELAKSANRPREEALSENRLAGWYLDRQEVGAARPHLERARQLAESLGEAVVANHVLANAARLAAGEGKTDEALRMFLDLEQRWRELERPLEEADALHNRASLLARQGKLEEAALAFEQCVSAQTSGGHEPGRVAALIHLGDTRLRLHRWDQAIEALEAAAEAGPRGKLDRRWSAFLDNSLGLAYSRVGSSSKVSDEQLNQAIEHFSAAQSKAEEDDNWRLAAVIKFNLGALLQEQGRSESAIAAFEDSLVAFERWGDESRRAMALLGLGLALRDQGHLGPALERLSTAVDLVEGQRLQHSGWDFRMWFLASKKRYFEELIDLLAELHLQDTSPRQGPSYAERALQVAERRRARTFLDSLAETHLRVDVPSGLLEQEKELLAALHGLQNRSRGVEDPSLELERQDLLVRLESLRGRILEAHPQFAALTRPAPLSLEEVRTRVLDRRSHLLVYSVGERRSFVWSLDAHGSLEIHSLAGRKEMEASVGDAMKWVLSRAKGASSLRHAALAQLADRLLPPPNAMPSSERWMIVPDGILEMVPFSALRVAQPSDSDRIYLLEQREVVVLPSASTLAAIRQEAPRRRQPAIPMAIFADPVFSPTDPRLSEGFPPTGRPAASPNEFLEFPRLSHSRSEALAIAQLLPQEARVVGLDFDAAKSPTFFEYLENAGILHLATHGIVDPQHPQLSSLLFSRFDAQGRPQEGHLYAHEIFDRRIAAELVVLSACQSGIGREVPGEGVQGLSRAFHYAGAPRVVMSLWNVNDRSTAALMQAFYRGLLEQRLAPAEALRTAQLSLLKGDQEAWREPRHWAAFVLSGDPSPDAKRSYDDPPIEKDAGGGGLLEPTGTPPSYPIPPDKKPSRRPPNEPMPNEQTLPRRGQVPAVSSNRFNPDSYINGIEAETGRRLPPAPDGEALFEHREKILPDPHLSHRLDWWTHYHRIDDPFRETVFGIDAERLDQAGWAVLFAPSVPPVVEEALSPLLRHRRDQAGAERFRSIRLPADCTSDRFRLEHELGFGPADPEVMPYFLMVVGDPEETPFEFQYGLDVQYALGRLCFDKVDDYARYADSVLQTEAGQPHRRRASIFGVGGDGDNERYLIDSLVDPLTQSLASPTRLKPSQLEIVRAASTRKADLTQLLEDPPALLFAAGHGLRCDPADRRLGTLQGALVCSDYELEGTMSEDAYFSGEDLSESSDLRGMIAFLFACYSAGSPAFDDFSERLIGPPQRIAPKAMISHLAKRMLARGAQGFVGHVDRAWGTSFDFSSGRGDTVKVFDSVCRQLLNGRRLGHAMECLNQSYAEKSTVLTGLLGARTLPPEGGQYLSRIRKATLDARNYIVVGDPAVRLPGVLPASEKFRGFRTG